jgi:uncharacterized protein Yka (UPF0111/DUF47 family)
VKLSLIPREHRFYELFRRQGALVSETLAELRESLADGKNRHSRLRELEHACDDVTHDIYNLTNRTFTTPMEQEDILRLAHGLDQIVDLAEEVSDKIDLYKIVSIPDSAKQFGECLAKAGMELAHAVGKLEDFTGIDTILQEIHSRGSHSRDFSKPTIKHPPTSSNGRTCTRSWRRPLTSASRWRR